MFDKFKNYNFMINLRRDIYDEIMNNTNPKSPKLKGIINIHME